jgi:hypothetical protein
MKVRNFALFVLACALVAPAYAAGPVKPGKWETTMEMDMPGMPMKMPPRTFTHCITKEQAENPENAVPRSDRQQDCKISDLKVEGSTVSWKMTCEKSQATGAGSITYSADSYTGHMDMKMAGDREMHMKYSGKYLGACDEK